MRLIFLRLGTHAQIFADTAGQPAVGTSP